MAERSPRGFIDWRTEPRLVEIEALTRTGGIEAAIDKARAAAADGVEHPMSLSLIAYGHSRAGHWAEAIDAVQRALDLDPGEPSLLISLGNYRAATGANHAALQAFDRALARAPGVLPALSGKARALFKLGDLAAAEALFDQVLRADPRAVDALSCMAVIAIHLGDFPRGQAFAHRALAADPQNSEAQAALAELALQARRFAEAETRLHALLARPALPMIERVVVQGLLGDALHGLGRHGEAFRAYRAGVAAFDAVSPDPGPAGGERESERVRRVAGYFRQADPEPWRRPAVDPELPPAFPRHAFLVGFLRSGTTLLENILRTHSGLVALEEVATLSSSIQAYFGAQGELDRLAQLKPAEADLDLAAHAARVRAAAPDTDGKLLLEKMPLYSAYLPLIRKLFPRAKILFAIRDPRDVVLSCFRRRIMTDVPFRPRLLSPEAAADFYDGVMTLAHLYLDSLGIEVLVVKHETLLTDFDGVTRQVFAHLGLDWTDQVHAFAEQARARAIGTPSANQVRRGLNTDGVGQWRAYREELASVLPRLAPWVERFGYPAD